jgi:hypothetical protein
MAGLESLKQAHTTAVAALQRVDSCFAAHRDPSATPQATGKLRWAEVLGPKRERHAAALASSP